jgi:hypothetical protein
VKRGIDINEGIENPSGNERIMVYTQNAAD